ncbi:MAG: ferritin-like domain-containing protein [Alphaproteobacteria bacterium]|nr:ferritin-like domain-containing protein [Alphaproteobacteria bacterium]
MISTSNLASPARRAFMGGAGRTVLSAAAVGLLANAAGFGSPAFAKAKAATSADVDVLNVALGLEHEAIGAYQIGAESGLLKPPALKLAVLFQSHHKGHRDALVATIGKLGGTALAAKTTAEYAADLGAAAIKTDLDVLKLAQKLELGAANAYLGVIPSFESRDLAQVSARLAADETMHWTALSGALGDMLPAQPLSFGA